jgi:hypothetical protein
MKKDPPQREGLSLAESGTAIPLSVSIFTGGSQFSAVVIIGVKWV